MSDTFDAFWTDEAKQASPVDDKPFVPDGKHVGKIVVAEVKDLQFKQRERNKAGTSLVVKVAINGYRLVEEIVPVQLRGIIEGICRSVGQEPPAKGESFAAFCGRLLGQSGPLETTYGVAASGREYVNVKWLEGIKPLPKEVEKRTAKPQPKAAAVDLAPDDIPF